MPLEIINAELEHVKIVRPILEQARLHKVSKKDYGWGTAPFLDARVAAIIERGHMLIGLIQGQPACVGEIFWEDPYIWGEAWGQDNLAGYVHRLGSADAFRHQGVGPLFLDSVGKMIREAGRPYERLDCGPQLSGYYEPQGFINVGATAFPHDTTLLYQRAV